MLLTGAIGCSGADERGVPKKIEQPGTEARMTLESIIGPTGEADSIFRADIARRLPPLDSVELVLGHAFREDTAARLYGVVIPYRQSVITTPEGEIFIGLNHYLGSDYEGYRGVFPPYMLGRKTIERLPVEVVQARLAGLYPPQFASATPTLAARLLYLGALLGATDEALGAGKTPVSTLTGLSDDDIKWWEENEGRLWHSLIEQDLLYSTDPAIADRLLSPAPSTGLLSASAPGQVLLPTALKIAQAYCRKTGKTAREMLANGDYDDNSTLVKSDYSPR